MYGEGRDDLSKHDEMGDRTPTLGPLPDETGENPMANNNPDSNQPADDEEEEQSQSTPDATGADEGQESPETPHPRETNRSSPPHNSHGADYSLSPNVREYVLADAEYKCAICDANGRQEDIKLNIHHRTPQADGGSNHPDNLIVLCKTCHQRHHNNLPARQELDAAETPSATAEAAQMSNQNGGKHSRQPLPPQSNPNGADKEILSLIEDHGPLSTSEIANNTDYTPQYVRRESWKLAGEQLIVKRQDNRWDLAERTNNVEKQIGLPGTAKAAARAGRDEVIRQMSAHGISHTEIAEITDLSRSTIDIAVNRARALRLNQPVDDAVDIATIATRLSALLDLIDHTQIE